MDKLSLPDGRIFQQAFIVQDIEDTLQRFARAFDIGGWLLIQKQEPWPIRYRGVDGGFKISVALGFSGDMMYELIEQHDDAPGVYKDTIAERGYGFHHWGIVVDDIDAEVARHKADGYDDVMWIEGNQGRAAYLDACPKLHGMLELIQRTPEFVSFAEFVHGRQKPLGADGPEIKRIG